MKRKKQEVEESTSKKHKKAQFQVRKNFNKEMLDQFFFYQTTDDNYPKSPLEISCKYGDYNDINEIVPNNIFKKFKDRIAMSLISKLCFLSEEDIHGKKNYDDGLIEFIRVHTGYLMQKSTSDNGIYCTPPKKQKVLLSSESKNPHEIKNMHKASQAYAKSIATLYKFLAGTVGPQEIKANLLTLIDLIDDNNSDQILKLFVFQIDFIVSIGQDVVDAILSKRAFFEKSVYLSNTLAKFFFQVEKMVETEEWAKISIDMIEDIKQDGVDKQHIFDTTIDSLELLSRENFFRLGVAINRRGDTEEAYNIFKKLYEQYQDHKAIIEWLHYSCEELGYVQEAYRLAEKHKLSMDHITIITKMIEKGENPSWESVKGLQLRHQVLVISSTLFYHAIFTKDADAVAFYKDMMDKKILSNEGFKELTAGSKAMVFILLNSENPNKVETYLKQSGINNEAKAKLLYDLSIIYSDPTKTDLAAKYIDLAIEYNSSKCEYLIHKKLLNKTLELAKQEARKQQSQRDSEVEEEKKASEETHIDTISTYIAKAEAVREEYPFKIQAISSESAENRAVLEYIEYYIESHGITNAQEIHKYFQQAKQQLLERNLLPPPAKLFGWNINETTKIKVDSVVNVLPNVYASIHHDIEKKYDAHIIRQLKEKLAKGFNVRAFGQEGIKILPKHLYELKSLGQLGDWRFVADKTYKNASGSELILFDYFCNHNNIGSYINTHSAQMIECANYFDEEFTYI